MEAGHLTARSPPQCYDTVSVDSAINLGLLQWQVPVADDCKELQQKQALQSWQSSNAYPALPVTGLLKLRTV